MNCPKCSSSEVHAEKRGWSLLTGFLGSRQIIITCLNCGKQFKPGEQHATPTSKRDLILGCLAVVTIIVLLTYFHNL